MNRKMLKSVLSLLTVFVAAVFMPMSVSAATEHVHPSELSLETLQNKEVKSIFSMVYYEDTLIPIVARSIGRSDLVSNPGTIPLLPAYADFINEDVTTGWLLHPSLGGDVDAKNTIIATKEYNDVMKEASVQLSTAMGLQVDYQLDVQVVPVFNASEDVMPMYVFIGYRMLDDKGTPYNVPNVNLSHPLAGTVFDGGSGYQYFAIKNGSSEQLYNYGTAEVSRKEKNEGFDVSFEPEHFFGNESMVVNDEESVTYTKETLPPGSSEAFLNSTNNGINAMEVGVAQANGESTGSSSNMLYALMPIVIMLALLLILMGN